MKMKTRSVFVLAFTVLLFGALHSGLARAQSIMEDLYGNAGGLCQQACVQVDAENVSFDTPIFQMMDKIYVIASSNQNNTREAVFSYDGSINYQGLRGGEYLIFENGDWTRNSYGDYYGWGTLDSVSSWVRVGGVMYGGQHDGPR